MQNLKRQFGFQLGHPFMITRKAYCLLQYFNMQYEIVENLQKAFCALQQHHFRFFYFKKNLFYLSQGNYQIGHPGYGGQFAKYDPHYKLSFAYLRNELIYTGEDFQAKSFINLEKAVYNALLKTKKIYHG